MPRKKKKQPDRKEKPDLEPGGHAWSRLRQYEDARGLPSEGLTPSDEASDDDSDSAEDAGTKAERPRRKKRGKAKKSRAKDEEKEPEED